MTVIAKHVRSFGVRAISCICLVNACEQSSAVTQHDSFEIKGIVEGFYGAPWSHQDRLDVLTFMGEVGLNAYFYAPKADPYHLSRWREPYPPDQWEDLRELVAAAADNDVTFWYAISPGLSMQYSAPDHYDALLAKIDTVATLGVRHFGLFLDDVPLELTNPDDMAAFDDLGTAHVDLINRLHGDLVERGYALAVTPTVYTSAWDSPSYVDKLGAGVRPEILLMWTGPDVAAPRITDAQSRAWSGRLRRRIVLWDNYPVNDFAPWRLFLGPLRGRDAMLPQTTTGILSNPMHQAHASMIPLFTLAEYTNDPGTYDPDASWQRAQQTVLGTEAADLLERFLTLFGGDAAEAHFLEPLYFFRDTIDLGSVNRALTTLEQDLAGARARGFPSPRVSHIIDELEPIVTRARARIEVLRGDPRYRDAAEDGILIFPKEDERYQLARLGSRPSVDGNLVDWPTLEWHELHGPVDGESSFAADESNVYIAVRVRAADIAIREGSRVGEGTHVAITITHDLAADRISSDDLFLMVAPRGDGSPDPHFLGTMKLDGFMAKWMLDNENLTFTDFHVSTFGDSAVGVMADVARTTRFASQRTATGFTMEIAFPHEARDHRVSLTVSTRIAGRMRSAALSRRNYPLNPATFVEFVLPR